MIYLSFFGAGFFHFCSLPRRFSLIVLVPFGTLFLPLTLAVSTDLTAGILFLSEFLLLYSLYSSFKEMTG